MLSRRLTTTIVVGLTAVAVGGGAYGIFSETGTSGSAVAGTPNVAKLGSNARSGPASGGASGTVASVSTSSFKMSTSAGQKLTVDEASSTTYQKGTSSTSASAVATGEPVLVLGTTSGTTANKATEAALAAYPGGIVDRVVKLSNGEYEVHNIGVNGPHHIFVNKNFKVAGAD